MKRLYLFLIASITLSAPWGWSQSPIANIVVKGAFRDAQVSEIRRALGFAEGDTVDAETIQLAIKRIGSNPIFRNVQIFSDETPNGLQILVKVELEPIIESIELVAPPPLHEQFESRLALLKGEPYSEFEVNKATKELLELSRGLGYFNTTISVSPKRLLKRGFVLLIDVVEGEKARVGTLDIRSQNKRIASEIAEATGLYVGESYSHERVLEGIKSWRQQKMSENYFDATIDLVKEDFSKQKNSVDVVIEAHTGPRHEIHFNNAKYFSTRYLRQKVTQLLTQSEIGASRQKRVESLLIDEYRRHGFRDVTVTVSEHLDISINEGRQHLISQLTVSGASDEENALLVASVKKLLKDEAESGTLSDSALIYVDDFFILDERALVKVKGQIQDELRGRGYLSAKFTGPQLRFAPKSGFAIVNFNVSFGPLTRVESIDVEVAPIINAEDIRTCIELKIDSPLIMDSIETPRACMEEFLWNRGYPYALVDADVQLSDDTRRARIKFTAKPGPFARISKVEIRGTVVTRPEALMSRIAAQIDEPYSLQKITITRQNLLDSDLFDRIEIFAEPGDENDETRALIIEVHEKSRTTLEVGVGASLEDGPRLSLVTGRRNLLGLGIGLKSRLQLNYPALFYRFPWLYSEEAMKELENRFKEENAFLKALLYTEARMSLSFDYPYMLNFPWTTDGVADFSINRDLKPVYTLNRFGLNLGVMLKPTSHLRFGPLVEYEFANFNCSAVQGYREGLGCGEGSVSAATRWIDKGETQQVTLKLSTTIDGRDSIVRPRKGYFVEANADLGVGRADLGDENSYRPIRYIKLLGSFSAFAPITRGATGYLSTRVGHIFDLVDDGYVPLFKKFYLGGTSTLRGFGEDQVLPADDPNWPAGAFRPTIAAPSTGGNFVALVRGEIRFHLAADYDGAVFIDTGELLRSPSNFSLNSLALGTGFGIRYATPIGPLMLDLGIRVLDGNRAYESGFWKLFGLHFSIGYF